MKYIKGKLNIPCSAETLDEIVKTDILLVNLESENMGEQITLYRKDFVKRLLASAKETKTLLSALDMLDE